MPPLASPPSDANQTPQHSSLASSAADQGKLWAEATEKIRARTDTSAKALGALGTTGITAAGLSKFSDIFPLPASPSTEQLVAVAGVLAGLLLMAAAVGWMTAMLWKVSQPIFMSSNLPQMRAELADADQYRRLETIYRSAARLNDAEELEHYASRGLRLERVAYDSADPAVRKRAEEEALQIRNDVMATQARAATNVVRQRAYRAVRSKTTLAIFVLFLFGLISFGVASDYLDSERAARVASSKSCAEAVKAVRDSSPATAKLLPTLCGGKAAVAATPEASPTPLPSTQKQTSGAIRDLAARHEACVAAAAPGDSSACASIKAAMKEALSE
jgi:hypothetical protein